jgi:palmitoyl transferase
MENIISANSRAILSYSLLTCTLLMSINGQAQENVANYQQQEMSSHEKNDGLWSSFKNNIAETWNKPQQQDLFIPVLTRHNRHTHSKKQIDGYNEHPWGGGYGVSRYDDKGNWHALYATTMITCLSLWCYRWCLPDIRG